jgi:16S rRNA (uracil1498-N3)-methyltransferase
MLPVRPETPLRLTEKLEPDIFYQLVKVLRVAPGDKVVLLPAEGGPDAARGEEFEYEVETAQKKEVVLRFTGRRKNENELDFRLGLLLCLPNKPDKLEMILQKAVEIGVAAVILVEGDFSRLKHNLRTDRLEKIMTEAAEQSERAYVPSLALAGRLNKYLEELPEEKRKNVFVAMERMDGDKGENHSLTSLLQKEPAKSARAGSVLQILIGPEGGFSPEEKTMIEKLELPCFSLGRRILRMETAAILSLGMAAITNDL